MKNLISVWCCLVWLGVGLLLCNTNWIRIPNFCFGMFSWSGRGQRVRESIFRRQGLHCQMARTSREMNQLLCYTNAFVIIHTWWLWCHLAKMTLHIRWMTSQIMTISSSINLLYHLTFHCMDVDPLIYLNWIMSKNNYIAFLWNSTFKTEILFPFCSSDMGNKKYWAVVAAALVLLVIFLAIGFGVSASSGKVMDTKYYKE